MIIKTTDIIHDLRKLANAKRAKISQRFFKTGPGQYGEGDVFWGIPVPQIRQIAKRYRQLPLAEVQKLLRHRVHEVRLCAICLLVSQYPHNSAAVYRCYLRNTRWIKNWDLVDMSAEYIVGAHVLPQSITVLKRLAKSRSVWERRMAIIATYFTIKQSKAEPTLTIAKLLLHDRHDLIHKAVGWMLREVGKRCSLAQEEVFLKRYAAVMPRTMLRYAIERFPQQKRKYYLAKGAVS